MPHDFQLSHPSSDVLRGHPDRPAHSVRRFQRLLASAPSLAHQVWSEQGWRPRREEMIRTFRYCGELSFTFAVWPAFSPNLTVVRVCVSVNTNSYSTNMVHAQTMFSLFYLTNHCVARATYILGSVIRFPADVDSNCGSIDRLTVARRAHVLLGHTLTSWKTRFTPNSLSEFGRMKSLRHTPPTPGVACLELRTPREGHEIASAFCRADSFIFSVEKRWLPDVRHYYQTRYILPTLYHSLFLALL